MAASSLPNMNFARALGYFWNLPIVPVNHIEAHIIANFIGESTALNKASLFAKTSVDKSAGKKKIFPAIALIVSGGHTQLILMKDFGKYKILGETKDDAAGECFDKVARILGLGYPGGPIISKLAQQTKRGSFSPNLPRPMIGQKNYDFSFSGLKTAVLYDFKKQSKKTKKSKKYISDICAKTQQAIIDVLIKKTIKAAKDYKVKTIILGGGVAANNELRRQFKETIKKNLPSTYYLTPNISLCTDNAVMIGADAYFQYLIKKTKTWKNIKVSANLRIG